MRQAFISERAAGNDPTDNLLIINLLTPNPDKHPRRLRSRGTICGAHPVDGTHDKTRVPSNKPSRFCV